MNMIFTTDGLDEIATLIAAGNPVQITELAIGTGTSPHDASSTALQTELKRLAVTGDKTADANVHLTAVDSTSEEYTVYEAGIYLASGTLLAVFGDGTAITGKAARVDAVFAIDLPLAQFSDAEVVIGGTGFMLPGATEAVAGVTKFATTTESETGTETSKAVTPAGVKAAMDNRTASTENTGLVELASKDESLNPEDDGRALTPSGLHHALAQPDWIWTGAREVGTPFQIISSAEVPMIFTIALSAMSPSSFVTATLNYDEILKIEFDGSTWVKTGNGYSYDHDENPVVAALSSTDIAVLRSGDDVLCTLRFDGTDWFQVGNSLPISAVTMEKSMVALSSSTVAIVNDNRDDLGFYEFDGTDWTQIGNRLPLSFGGQNVYRSRITALASNRIAFASSNNVLVVYEFNGSDWAQIGNTFALPTSYWLALSALNATDVAIVNNETDDLRVYRFDGTDWQQMGRPLNINVGDSGERPISCAISGNELLVFLSEDDAVHSYVIDYAPSVPPSPALGTL